jgi:hypothetical protein
MDLTSRARTVDDGVVRRAISLVVLLILVVSGLSRTLSGFTRTTSNPHRTFAEASAQPPRAPEPATIAPQAVGTITSQRLISVNHDVLAVHTWLPASSGDVSTKITLNPFPLRASRSSLTYPLLI